MHFQSVLVYSKHKPTINELKAKLKAVYSDLEITQDFYNFFIETSESIGIDAVLELTQWNSKSIEEGHKIAVIFNAQLLTLVAQNSLLKLVEEPSQNTLIVLVTNNTDSIIETIRSRTKYVHMQSYDDGSSDTEVDEVFKASFSSRAVLFSKIVLKDRALQEEYLSDIYHAILKKGIQDKNLLQTILTLQKSIRSQVQSNLIFDNLNLALNEINFNVY